MPTIFVFVLFFWSRILRVAWHVFGPKIVVSVDLEGQDQGHNEKIDFSIIFSPGLDHMELCNWMGISHLWFQSTIVKIRAVSNMTDCTILYVIDKKNEEQII